jgi:hypothetical protein
MAPDLPDFTDEYEQIAFDTPAPLPPRRRFIAALAAGFVVAAVVGVWRAWA